MATVENRVVEMKFDNAQFEQGVKQTISSLEQLKTALNLNSATTGLSTLQSAYDSFKLDNIQNSVDALTNKFSTLGIVGMTAIQNITNKVIDFASNKVTSAFNQIVTGGWSRASNIAQSRFTLKGLFGDELYDVANGVTKVEEAFNNASDAVDGTAYSLDSAVSVASQLSASGVEVGDQMSQVLKSISGVAAMTGDTYDSIGNIYTTVAGNGRLMGMQLTQLSTHGLNAAATIAEYLNTTEAEVRDMVSKGEIDFQTFSDAMYEAFGEHAKDANKTFSGSMDNIKSALSRIGAIFSSGIIENEDLIDFLNDVRVSINNIKKAIEPLEVPFKNLISTMSKVASGIITTLDVTGFAKFIEYITVGVEALTDWFNQFIKVKESVYNIIGISDYEFAKSGQAIGEAAENLQNFYDLLDDTHKAILDKAWDIWMNGTYGNGADRIAALGDEYEDVQDAVNAGAGSISSFNDFAEAYYNHLQTATTATETFADESDKLSAKVENAKTVMDGVRIAADGVKAIISSLVNVFKAVKSSFTKVFTKNGFISDLATVSGLFTGLVQTFEITNERSEKLAIIFEAIFSVIAMVKDIILALASGISRKLNPAVSNLYDGFLDILVAVAKVILKFTSFVKENKTLHSVLEFLGGLLFGTAAKVKYFFEQFMQLEAVQKIKDKLKVIGDYIGEKLSPIFETAEGYVGSFFDKMSEGDTEGVDKLLENVNAALETLIDLCDNAWGKIDTFTAKMVGVKQALADFGITADTLNDGVETVEAFTKTVKESESATSFFDNLTAKFGGLSSVVDSVGEGINNFVSSISDSIGKVLVAGFGAVLISLTMRLSNFVKVLTGLVSSVASVPKAVGSSIKMVGEGIKKYFINKSKAELVKNYAIALGVLAVSLIALAMVPADNLYRALMAMSTLIVVFGVMVKVITALPKNAKPEQLQALKSQIDSLATIILSFAASILLLSLALMVLTNNVKWENIKEAGITLGVFMAAMLGVVFVMSKFASSSLGQFNVSAFAILAMAGAVWIMAKALEELSNLEVTDLKSQLINLGILVVMMATLLAASHLAKLSGAFTIIAMILAIWAIEKALKWVIQDGVTEAEIEANAGKLITLFGSMLLIAIAVRIASENCSIGSALTLLAFTYAVATIFKVMAAFSQMPWGGIVKALAGMAIIVASIAVILSVLNGEKKNAVKAAAAILVISIAMFALTGLVKVINFLTPDELSTGISILAWYTLFIGALLVCLKFAEGVKASTIWALTSCIAALVVMTTLMSLIQDKDSLFLSAGVIATLLISLGLSLYLAGKEADKIKISSLIVFIVAIAVLGGIVAALTAMQDPISTITAGIAMMLLMVAFGSVVSELSEKLQGKTFNLKQLSLLIIMIGAVVVIGASIMVLSRAVSESGIRAAIVATAAIALILAEVVGLITYLMKNLKGTSTTVNRLVLIGEIIVMIAAIGASIALLTTATKESGIGAAIAATISIGIMLILVVELLKTIANIKSDNTTVKKLVMIGEVIIMIVALGYAISMVAKSMAGLNGSQIAGTIISLSVVLLAISAFLVIVSTIKTITIGQLAALIISIFLIGAVADALKEVLLSGADWKKMIAAAVSLGIVLLSISASLAILTAIGSTGISIVAMLAAALVISVVLLAIAESIKIFSEAMYMMVEAVKMLSEIDYSKIDTGKLWDLVKIMAAVSGIAVLLVVVLGLLSPLVAIVAVLALVFAGAFAIVASNATNFLTALNGVIDSITNFITLIASLSSQMDTIKENIVGIGSAIGTGLATAISTFITTLANNIETIKESIKQIVVTIATTIGECAGVFAAAGVLIIFSFLQGFIETLNDSLPGIVDSLAQSVTITINAIADAIYKNADAIQEAVQTLMDVITVKIKEGGGFLSYLIDDTDYIAATLRLSDKMADAGDEAGEATGDAITDKIDEKTSGFDITSLGSENSWLNVGGDAGDTTSEGFLTSLTNGVGEFNIDDFLSTDQLTSDYGIDFSNLGSTDLTDQFTELTNTTDTSMADMADSNAESYYNELDNEFSAAEYAQHGLGAVELDNSEEIYATQAEADANTYRNDYTDAINEYDGSGVAEGVASWTTSEEAVETLKQSGEDGADNWIQGFINGVYAMSADLRAAVINSINGNVVDATAEAEDAQSPSKKGYKLGMWWDQGVANGITENGYLMSDAIFGSFKTLDSDMEQAAAHINAVVNNALDYEPTITPVLDTTGITNQAGVLNSVLDGQYSMQLAAQNQLEIDHANENSLAKQIEDLRSSVQSLANKDYSKILEGVNINVDASTNVDGKPLFNRASKHTIQVIDDQERSYIMAKGGRV